MATNQSPTRKQASTTDPNSSIFTGGLKRKPFFYDAQFKRLIVQVLAAFAGYQVRTGIQRDGKHHFLDVPVIYGGMDRAAAYILRGGSENVMPYLPLMSMIDTGYRQKKEWRQQPQHIEKLQIIERARDKDGKLIVGQPGKRKTIERFMPVPYEVQFDLAIWTSNKDQALQIIEQLGVVFNPEIDIALSNSLADWAFLTQLYFDGDIRIDNVQASGTDADPFTMHSMSFSTVLWLSPPVKVRETKDIHSIHVPILDLGDNDGEAILRDIVEFEALEELDKLVINADEEDVLAFETFG